LREEFLRVNPSERAFISLAPPARRARGADDITGKHANSFVLRM